MPASRFAHLVAFIALTAGLGACDALSGPSALEREIAAEQETIAAYSAAVPEVDAAAAAFAEAWQRANRHADPVVLREDLRAHAIPAGRSLVAALRAMPAGDGALAALHAPLVSVYEALVSALDAFAASAATLPLDEAYAPVTAALEALRNAEAAYRRALELHVTRHRAVLAPPPAPAAPAAPAP